MAKNDKRKQSLYFPEDMLDEIMKEAIRQDRSISWVMQQAWIHSKDKISLIPSHPSDPRPAGGKVELPDPYLSQHIIDSTKK